MDIEKLIELKDILQKGRGKAAKPGEVRTRADGSKWRKTGNGWDRINEGGGSKAPEDQPMERGAKQEEGSEKGAKQEDPQEKLKQEISGLKEKGIDSAAIKEVYQARGYDSKMIGEALGEPVERERTWQEKQYKKINEKKNPDYDPESHKAKKDQKAESKKEFKPTAERERTWQEKQYKKINEKKNPDYDPESHKGEKAKKDQKAESKKVKKALIDLNQILKKAKGTKAEVGEVHTYVNGQNTERQPTRAGLK